MPQLAALIELLEQVAPPSWAAEWDNVGLQVGDLSTPVSHVALTVDVTTEVIAQAAAGGAQLLIAHHPLLFRPLKSLATGNPVSDGLVELIKQNLALYVAHTNLDQAPCYGTTAALARQLKLQNLAAPLLEPPQGLLKTGQTTPQNCESVTRQAGEAVSCDEVIEPLGYVGAGLLPAPQTLGEWAVVVGQRLGVRSVQVTGELSRRVQRVTVAPGSGGSAVAQVANQCDVLVTGELGHHDLLEATQRGLAVITVGHAASEAPVCLTLQGLLKQRWPQLLVTVLPPPALITTLKVLT